MVFREREARGGNRRGSWSAATYMGNVCPGTRRRDPTIGGNRAGIVAHGPIHYHRARGGLGHADRDPLHGLGHCDDAAAIPLPYSLIRSFPRR